MTRLAVHVCLTRPPWRLPVLLPVLLALAVGPCDSGSIATATGPGTDSDRPDHRRPDPLLLDDVPELFVPERARTEAEEDRVEALALFAAGRMFERQQQYADALRNYQRALRRDPEAVAVVRGILRLAYRLNRRSEAARYALKVIELEDADPQLLPGEEGMVDAIRQRIGKGRLHCMMKEYGKGADCFAEVTHALDHPDEYGLDKRSVKLLLGEVESTYNAFGDCFLEAGRFEEAMAAFRKSHKLAPNKGLLEFNVARVHARNHKPADALASLQGCFREPLADAWTAPYELLAEVLEDLGTKSELMERLERLLADDPENVPLRCFLAEQYRGARQFEKVEPLLRELVNRTPSLPDRELVEIYRNLVASYRDAARADALLATLGEMVQKTGSLDKWGAEVEAICDDAELMRTLAETAQEQHRQAPEQFGYGVRLAIALLALEAKQHEMAAEFFNLALEARPQQAAELLMLWGVGLLLQERATDAVSVFQRAIDEKVLPEDDPRFHYFLAGALEMDGQTDKALAAARDAAATKKGSARLQSRVAWILYHAKRTDEAIEAYRKLIDKFDGDYASAETRDVLRNARLVLSNLCVEMDDLAAAEEWLEQVLDEFPDDIGALNDLGYLWADQERQLQRALRMIRKAVDGDPDNAAYRDSLGWALYRLGRYDEAIAELEKAVALDRQDNEDAQDGEGELADAVILDHLGDVYLKANRPQEAKQAWGRAVEAFTKAKQPEKAEIVQQKIKD